MNEPDDFWRRVGVGALLAFPLGLAVGTMIAWAQEVGLL